MVVLNFYGKIEPICISEKLGLYIANLPNGEHNEWRDALADEIELAVKADKIYQEKLGTNYSCGIFKLYQAVFPDESLPKAFTYEHFVKIADQMIYIYQDYDYPDMPLGGWDTNCFDGRLCEEAAEYIPALQEWGKLFDDFLCSRNDYLLFDYLVNTIQKDNEYNESHLMKAFSLCQLFLEKHKESELDSIATVF